MTRLEPFLVVLLVNGIWASLQNPFISDSNECSLRECQPSAKFNWTVGRAYSFNYQTIVQSSLVGVSPHYTGVHVQCDVALHVISPCEHAIKLSNVHMRSTLVEQGKQVNRVLEDTLFSDTLQQHHLRYSYHDGVIEELCPSNNDASWSVNFKRGILSLLQNTMLRLDLHHEDIERDVTGDCMTSYRLRDVTSEGLVIEKFRDLSACNNRYSHNSHIQSVSYNFASPVQSLPIISSTSQCEQVVRSSKLLRANCSERHLLRPFSNNQTSGAVTVVTQTLQAVVDEESARDGEDSDEYVYEEKSGTTKASEFPDVDGNRVSLLYDHMPSRSAFHPRSNSLDHAVGLVQNLCQDDSEVRLDTAMQFYTLIGSLRGMHFEQLLSLYQLSASICRHGQKFIEDALPAVSTTAAMTLMRDLIVGQQVSTSVANSWLLSLNFIPSVDEEMLGVAVGLLAQKRAENKVRTYLAVGAVAHQFCRQHERCQSTPALLEIARQLATPLGSNCQPQNVYHEKLILLSLRALSNAGVSTNQLQLTLGQCMLSSTLPNSVKVAVIEVFRRLSCNIGREQIRSVFNNYNEDAEVRIAAYLALMRCPSFKLIEMIYNGLSHEPINQVGSFVWTHLTNLQETASAYKLEIQGLLADLELQQKYSNDARKFSTNFEWSAFNADLHMGATLDSNLVYSPRSYVPRSIMSNLSLEIFGENINLMEVGVRAEGLEQYIEKALASGRFADWMSTPSSSHPSMSTSGNSNGGQLAKLADKFNASAQFGEPNLTFHMKLFGHEIEYLDLRGAEIQQLLVSMATGGTTQWLSKLANTETIDYSRTLNFLDGTYIVPTAAGVPLNLSATAVAAVNLQLTAELKLDQLFTDRQLKMALKVKPSAAVTFDGSMTVDAMVVQCGVNMQATYHTSTLLDTSLDIQGLSQIEANFNMPKERMDLYNFQSSVQFIYHDAEVSMKSPIELPNADSIRLEHNSCSGGGHYKGWHTCAYLTYVNASSVPDAPYFPLTGPARLGLYVEKTDKTMTGYLFKWRLSRTTYNQMLSVDFDTPMSTVKRAVSLKLRRRISNGRMGFRMSLMGRDLNGVGYSWWDDEKKGLELTFQSDGVNALDFAAVLESKSNGSEMIHSPSINVVFLGNTYVKLSGTVKQIDEVNANRRIIDMDLATPLINIALDSEATQSRPLYKSEIHIKHTKPGDAERELLMLLEARQESDGHGGIKGNWLALVDLNFSARTKLVRAVRWDWKNSPVGSLSLFQTAMRPEDFGDNVVFSMGYATNFISNVESSKVNGSVELRYPSIALDLKLAIEHENIHQGLRNKFLLRISPDRELRSVLNVTGMPLLLTGHVKGHWHLGWTSPNAATPLATDLTTTETPPPAGPLVTSTYVHGVVRLIPQNRSSLSRECQFRFVVHMPSQSQWQMVGRYRTHDDYQEAAVQHNITFRLSSSLPEDSDLPQDEFVPVVISGSAVALLKQTGAKTMLMAIYNRDEYKVDVDYFLTLGNTFLERTIQLSIIYPYHDYSVYGSLGFGDRVEFNLGLHLDRLRDIQLRVAGKHNSSRTDGSVDLSWDAERDPSRRVAVSVAVDRLPTTSSSSSVTNDRVDNVTLEPIDTNVTATLIYTTSMLVLNSHTSLTGNWNQMELDNHVILNYNNTAHPSDDVIGSNDDGSVSMRIVVSTDLQEEHCNVTGRAVLETPFQNWDTSHISLRHWRDTEQLQLQVTTAAGGRSAELLLGGVTQLPAKLELQAQLSSAGTSWPDMSVQLMHDKQDRSVESSLAINSNNHHMNCRLQLDELSNSYQNRYLLLTNVSSSIQGFQTAGFLVDAVSRPGEIRATASTSLEDKGHDLNLKASIDERSRCQAVATIDQLHTGMNQMKIQLALDPTAHGRSAKAEIKWPSGRAAVEADFYVVSAHDFGLGVQFISPFVSLSDAGLMLKHRIDFDGVLDSEVRVAWLVSRQLAASLKMDLRQLPQQFQLAADLRLPLDQLSRLGVELSHQLRQQLTAATSALTVFVNEQKMSVGVSGSLTEHERAASVTLISPFGVLKEASLSAQWQCSADSVVHKFSLSSDWQLYNSSSQKIRATGHLNLGSFDGAAHTEVDDRVLRATTPRRIKFRLLTPWTPALYVDGRQKAQGGTTDGIAESGNSVSTSGTVQVSLGEHSAHLDAILMSKTDGSSHALSADLTSESQWIPAVHIDSAITISPIYNVTLSVVTPDQYRLMLAADVYSAERTYLVGLLQTPLHWLHTTEAELEVTTSSHMKHSIGGHIQLPAQLGNISLQGSAEPSQVQLVLLTPFSAVRSAELLVALDRYDGDTSSSAISTDSTDDDDQDDEIRVSGYHPELKLSWNDGRVQATGSTRFDSTTGRLEKLEGIVSVDVPQLELQANGTLSVTSSLTSPDNQLTYDVKLSAARDSHAHSLTAFVYCGPLRYGLKYLLTSSRAWLGNSGTFVYESQQMSDALSHHRKLLVQISTHHQSLQNVTFNVYYSLGKGRNFEGGWKLEHAVVFAEGSTRVLLQSWRAFETSFRLAVAAKNIKMTREIRLFHRIDAASNAANTGGRAGFGWQMDNTDQTSDKTLSDSSTTTSVAPGHRYHVQLEYNLTALMTALTDPGGRRSVELLLLAGPDVWQDRQAPTHVSASVDCDAIWPQMARALLNVEILQRRHTFDVEFSSAGPITGSIRAVGKGGGLQRWEVTAQTALDSEQVTAVVGRQLRKAATRWFGSLNVTLPVAKSERILCSFSSTPAFPLFHLSGGVNILPRSSFHSESHHNVKMLTDFSRIPQLVADLTYERSGRFGRNKQTTSANIKTIYKSHTKGVKVSGRLADTKYEVDFHVTDSELNRPRSGHLAVMNVSTGFESVRNLLAQYSMKTTSEDHSSTRTTFGCELNGRSLVQGVYTGDRLINGTRMYSLQVENPLHPFVCNASHFLSQTLTQWSVGASSLMYNDTSIMLATHLERATPGSQRLNVSLSTAAHRLTLAHSAEQLSEGASRALRLQLNPDLFVAAQLDYNNFYQQTGDGGGLSTISIDIPGRTMALKAGGRLVVPSAGIARESTLQTSVELQWDVARHPEHVLRAGLEFADLSSDQQQNYNFTLTADCVDKPVLLTAAMTRSTREPLHLRATARYSPDADSLLTFSYAINNRSRTHKLDLVSTLYLAHPASAVSITGKGQLQKSDHSTRIKGLYTYLDERNITQRAEVEMFADNKRGDFNGKVSLPSTIYELESVSTAQDYSLNANEVPLDYRSPRSLALHVRFDKPMLTAHAVYDARLNKRVRLSAGVLNRRHWQVSVDRQSSWHRINDVLLFARLNHSHLFTAQASWRTELLRELKTWIGQSAHSQYTAITRVLSHEWQLKFAAVGRDMHKQLQEQLQLLREEIASDNEGSLRRDLENIIEASKSAYDDNVFYVHSLKDWVSYFYGEDDSLINVFLDHLSVKLEQLNEEMGLINDAFYDKLNEIIEYIRAKLSSASETGGQSIRQTLKLLAFEMADAYNTWVRKVYLRVSRQIDQAFDTLSSYINSRVLETVEHFRPQLLMLHHVIESSIVRVTTDVLNWFHGEFTQSELFVWMQSQQQAIDELYTNIQQRDAITNIADYTSRLLRWGYEYFELDNLFGEPLTWIYEQWQNPPPLAAKLKSAVFFVYNKVSWVANQLEIGERLHKMLLQLYHHGDELWSHSAIANSVKYTHGKATMIMQPEKGYISYVQLLPMPWHGFDQQPEWMHLPEMQQVASISAFFQPSSQMSLYELVYHYWPGTDPRKWMPPHDVSAVLSGSHLIVTFDGAIYTVDSDCSYLLAGDLQYKRFFLIAQFSSTAEQAKILRLESGNHSVVLGASSKFSIDIDGQSTDAPVSVGEVTVTRSGDVITLRIPDTLTVDCNQRADLCSIKISGWLYGRTGGLLGTYDREPFTDNHSPDHVPSFPQLMAAAWSLDSCRYSDTVIQQLFPQRPTTDEPYKLAEGEADVSSTISSGQSDGLCWSLLGSHESEYQMCHRLINPAPFLQACLTTSDGNVGGNSTRGGDSGSDRCVAIQAYVMACQNLGMPLKVPNKCVRCDIRGHRVIEGRTVIVNNDNPSTEVVFIVEAKQCNVHITQPRAIRRLVAALETALVDAGFVDTKYAVVAFGGSGSLAQPQVLSVSGGVFNYAGRAVEAFSNIQPGNGDGDVFGALRMAALLPFSAGVSRTFILLPCSSCAPGNQSLDYTTLANAFAEHQVTLHVLVHAELKVGRRDSGTLLGIDRDKAWTTSDAVNYEGDSTLIKRVHPPKSELQLCDPLARKETKGSVFSASRFRPAADTGRMHLRRLRPLLTVLSRRVAATALPRDCERCECVTSVDGTARAVCYPCSGLLPLDPEDDIFLEEDY